jgi:hypothetical protein
MPKLSFTNIRRAKLECVIRPAITRGPMRCRVEDLDGNVLRLGSEPREDQPIGEWLDMQRIRWIFKDGRWTRA